MDAERRRVVAGGRIDGRAQAGAALVVDHEAHRLEDPERDRHQEPHHQADEDFLGHQQHQLDRAQVGHGIARRQRRHQHQADGGADGVAQHAGQQLAVEQGQHRAQRQDPRLRQRQRAQEDFRFDVGDARDHVAGRS
ncbi:hypothetical protein BBAD15_g12564 [Beauveria bassiana D1-5]|uniref:Uncharacterized protein n=1 Tax=Beauveria bassiana D1-5 TaxID=1245745 RepID=A0A0A2V446_BEABA|nr:hypothetical protein BBAD15_g12564 [Beauveria bassiana D1-5]